MIKVSAILFVGLLVAALLRRQSAALRHWVLASAIACAAAMPVVQMIAPAWQFSMPAFWASSQRDGTAASLTEWKVEGQAAGDQAVAAAGRPGSALPSLEQIWLAGTIFSLSLLLVGFGRLTWVTSRSRQIVDGTWSDIVATLSGRRRPRNQVRLLQTDHPTLLVTWGLTQPKVILPRAAREWPADRVRAVLGHELAHVERRDWAVQMLAELLRCIYWFNPLIWLACRRLRQESEKACDDAVLGMGMDAPEYATHLLDVAHAFRHTHSRRSLFPAPAMARPSHLERRVRVMLNTGLSHAPLGRLAGIAVVAALLGVSVSIAGVVAASDGSRAARSNVAVTTRSVSGDQQLTADVPATSADRVTVASIVRPQAQRAGSEPAPVAASSRTAEQVASADYSGLLTDPTGRPMSGAVALVNTATARRIEFNLNESGEFSANGLPAGEYQLEAKRPGFMTIRKQIVLAAGQQLREKLVAQIGSLAETVVVQGGGPATANAAPAAPRQNRTPAEPPADPCAQSTAGGCLTPPMKLLDVKPAFPASHATDGAAGTVVIEGRVGIDGFVKDMKANDEADAAFAASALEAVRQWQFSPVKLNGIPQECRIEVTVKFVASDR